jgi:uncharacterized protein (DUF305 family)
MTSQAMDADRDSDSSEALGTQARRLRRWRAVALALAVLLVAAAAGATAWVLRSGAVPSQASPEVGFARDMYVHHGQAVTMALLVREDTDDPVLESLAVDIITGQAEQQGRFVAWLDTQRVPPPDATWRSMAWMHAPANGSGHGSGHGGADATAPAPTVMPGMATDAELSRLGTATGRPAEVLFLQLMLRHHRAGVDMADAFLARSDEPQLAALARGIVTSQQREVDIMTRLLAERGAPASQ